MASTSTGVRRDRARPPPTRRRRGRCTHATCWLTAVCTADSTAKGAARWSQAGQARTINCGSWLWPLPGLQPGEPLQRLSPHAVLWPAPGDLGHPLQRVRVQSICGVQDPADHRRAVAGTQRSGARHDRVGLLRLAGDHMRCRPAPQRRWRLALVRHRLGPVDYEDDLVEVLDPVAEVGDDLDRLVLVSLKVPQRILTERIVACGRVA